MCILCGAMKAVLLVTVIFCIALFYSNNGCKDPLDYEPPVDTLLPPPGPPRLLSPIDHYIFMDPDAMPGTSFFIYVDLWWEAVPDAEAYQLELVTDTLPPVIRICEDNSFFFVIHDDATRLCEYRWRVRAGNFRWEVMTDWSEEWRFEARWCPFGPELLSPVNYSTITVDSLPVSFTMQWSVIAEAQFYEVRIFDDTILVDSNITISNSYQPIIGDTSIYCWMVRAGSSLWQHFSFPSALFYFIVRLRH